METVLWGNYLNPGLAELSSRTKRCCKFKVWDIARFLMLSFTFLVNKKMYMLGQKATPIHGCRIEVESEKYAMELLNCFVS